VPLHFTAFHPDWKMTDVARTPAATLTRAREIAQLAGLNYVYTGNVHDETGGSTYCASCGEAVIRRDWYDIRGYHVVEMRDSSGACGFCGARIAGRFQKFGKPFGPRRIPVRLESTV
jgi:pyruvate formate lyase activating enzyme